MLGRQAGADARAEREEVWGAEALRESGVACEDDAEELLGVEVLAGEDAQLVEDGGESLLGLVDDEDRTPMRGADVIGPACAQGFEAAPPVVRGERHGEQISELSVEVHGAALRMLDRADEDVGELSESFGEEPQGDALPGARISSEHGEAAVGDAELCASEVAVDGWRGEERVGGDVGSEGMELESVEREELAHEEEFSGSKVSLLVASWVLSPCSSWSASSCLVMKPGGSPVAT